MSFTRTALFALTLAGAAGVGCKSDRNEQDEVDQPSYGRTVEPGAQGNESGGMAPSGTTTNSNTRGGTPMSTDTPSGTDSDMATPTGAGTSGTGNIAPAQGSAARRGTSSRTQGSDGGVNGASDTTEPGGSMSGNNSSGTGNTTGTSDTSTDTGRIDRR